MKITLDAPADHGFNIKNYTFALDNIWKAIK